MLRLLGLLALTLLMAVPVKASEPLPDIFFYSGQGMGGIGRLAYNPVKQTYDLANGLLTPFVVEQGEPGSIRAMRPDEGGGMMAEPSALVAIGSDVFGMLAPYNTLLKLGANTEIVQQGQFGDFAYQGSAMRTLQAHNGHLFLMLKDGSIAAYDTNLKLVGSVKPQQLGWANAGFQIAGNKLFAFGMHDPRPAMNCAGEGECGSPYTIAVVIDISNPADMKIERDEQRPATNMPSSIVHQAIDVESYGWLVVNGNYEGGERIEWRDMDNPSNIHASLSLGRDKVIALIPTAPFYAIIKRDIGASLQRITRNGNNIVLGDDIPLLWQSVPSVTMQQVGNRLYLTSGSQLRIVNLGNAPRLAHMQNFTGAAGDLFKFNIFVPVSGLPPAATGANRQSIEALLALDYLDEIKQMELESHFSRLTSEDKWAVPLLTEKLGLRGGTHQIIHPFIIKGLANMGASAVPAIPALLNVTMDGAAINGITAFLVPEALRLIDPQGDETLKAIPAFVSSHYEAGAKHVVRDVLSRMSGSAAQAALAEYQ